MFNKTKKQIKVAFQGEARAYSEEAVLKFFGKNIKTLSYENFSDVFKAVEKNRLWSDTG